LFFRLLGIVVAIYAVSYAYFLSQQVDELELMSSKAKAKAKPDAKPKAKPAAAAAEDADDE
jgi:Tfp pilus assembly protein PilO